MTDTTSVLVVEDEGSFIEALEIGLSREGFKVTVARDGAEALDIFDAVDPDLVLLDVMLPKVSGIDVCRELRSRSSDADVRRASAARACWLSARMARRAVSRS